MTDPLVVVVDSVRGAYVSEPDVEPRVRLPEEPVEGLRRTERARRFQLAPYYLTLVQRTPDGEAPLAGDPMWRQVLPVWEEPTGAYDYDGVTGNWEMPAENACFAYCQFCYEALRTLEKDTAKGSFQQEHWAATVEIHTRALTFNPFRITDELVALVRSHRLPDVLDA
jgi:L-lysine 2,3-aminomutase